MAVYVTSDAHGHLVALKEALELAGVGPADELYVLGDMIDRGPDPIGVIDLVRSMSNAHVLLGNHEELMLDAIKAVGAPRDGFFNIHNVGKAEFSLWYSWMQNGGGNTAEQLETFGKAEFNEFISWLNELPLFAVVEAGERLWGLVHAGISPTAGNAWRYFNPGADLTKPAVLTEFLQAQNPEDLNWIREDFWCKPTGLIDEQGQGPIIVAGHTPTPNLPYFLHDETLPWQDAEGHALALKLGACEATGGVPDRICIDSAAAVGAGMGQVCVMRLDDGELFYAPIKEGE